MMLHNYYVKCALYSRWIFTQKTTYEFSFSICTFVSVFVLILSDIWDRFCALSRQCTRIQSDAITERSSTAFCLNWQSRAYSNYVNRCIIVDDCVRRRDWGRKLFRKIIDNIFINCWYNYAKIMLMLKLIFFRNIEKEFIS